MVTNEVAKFKLRVLKHVSNVVKGGVELPPVMYVRTSKGKFKIMPVAPQLMAEKELRDKCREIMQHMLTLAKADLVCFVSEAYVSSIRRDEMSPEELRRAEAGRPSREDYKKATKNRTECIFLSFETKGLPRENELMTFKVENKSLQPHHLMSEMENSGVVGNAQGNFQNLFEQ